MEWYPSGHIPTVTAVEDKIKALERELLDKNSEYKTVNLKSKELAQAQRDIDEFLRQERNEQEQKRKKNKNGDLE